MTIYLNMKTVYGIETVDEFTREKGQNPIEFRRYVSKVVREYRENGMNVYRSQRCTKDWKNN